MHKAHMTGEEGLYVGPGKVSVDETMRGARVVIDRQWGETKAGNDKLRVEKDLSSSGHTRGS